MKKTDLYKTGLIDLNEALQENHKLALSVINSYTSRGSFKRVLEQFATKISYGDETAAFYFWTCLSDFEKMESYDNKQFFDVSFDYFDERVDLKFETLYYYAKIACKNYIKECPEEKAEVDDLLEKMRLAYGIQTDIN